MRATYRCSRNGSARHNDRTFDLSKAEHIDQRLTEGNRNWHWMQKTHPQASFTEAEKAFYEKRYTKSLNAINERYMKQYHPERCKTIDDLLNGAKTCPTETILQIGNKDEFPKSSILQRAVNDLIKYLNNWNSLNGGHYHLLDISLHIDEKTPHVHMRSCWDYIDQDGNPRLGQEKALAQAGVDLPDPSKPVGRYNNRKMTFDAMVRDKWQEILKSKGVELETIPLPRRKHQIKEAFIDGQIAKKAEQVEQLEKELRKLNKQVEWTKSLRDKQQALGKE